MNNSGAICNSWKLDPTTLRFPLRGMLPFDKVTHAHYTLMTCARVPTSSNNTVCVHVFHMKDLFEPQTGLLRYVLEQPYSREMVCNMLGLNKQVKQPLLLLLLSFFCTHLLSLFSSPPVSHLCRSIAILLFRSARFNLLPSLCYCALSAFLPL